MPGKIRYYLPVHYSVLFGDTLTYDRYRWMIARMPKTSNKEKVLDIGCGNGSFSLSLAKRGYAVTGLTWSKEDAAKAAGLVSRDLYDLVTFVEYDARDLENYNENLFDVILCLENIEHIIDDQKLISDIYKKLAPGGLLLLTTPNYFFKPISSSDTGPFPDVETGAHVRRGYTRSKLIKLCEQNNLIVEEVSYSGSFFSQLLSRLQRILSALVGRRVSWLLVLPLRSFQVFSDFILKNLFTYPSYSICITAQKL